MIGPRPNLILSSKRFEKVRLESNRTFDPNDAKWMHFAIAASYFWRKHDAMFGTSATPNKTIDYIEYVVNMDLQAKFDAKKVEFTRKGIPADQIMAFHATKPGHVDSIIENNLDYRRFPATHGRVHGEGNYFSEYPAFSLKYGSGLILFEILLGREHSGSSNYVASRFDSKKVKANAEGYGEQLVITDNAQFFPRYVIHLK